MKKIVVERIWKISAIAIIVLSIGAGGIFINYKARPAAEVLTRAGALVELTVEERLEDFNYMYKILEENHPYFQVEKRKTGYDWLTHKKDFESWIKAANNNEEYYRTLERILCLVQSGHTNIISPEVYYKYRQLFTGAENSAWRSVLHDKDVADKYEAWKEIVHNKSIIIPLDFKYIEGNYVATNPSFINEDILKQYDIPKYSLLKAVDGVKTDDYIKSIMDKKLLQLDDKRSKLKTNRLTLSCEEGRSMVLTFLTPEGKTVDINIKGMEYEAPDAASVPEPEKLYDTEIIEKDKLTYIKISSFSAFYVEKDNAGIYNFFKEIKDYQNLIIDIRGNGGGSDNYYTKNLVPPLIDKRLEANFYMAFRDGDYIKPFLKARDISPKSIDTIPDGLKYPDEIRSNFSAFLSSTKSVAPSNQVGFKGKIFLIVDDRVYSAAESFAVFTKTTGFAVIVGTRTGGDGIGIDPGLFALPNSGLVIRFPLEMGLNPDGTSSEESSTEPDVYAEQTYEDFIKYSEYDGGIINPYDTVLNKVIELVK